MLLKNIVIGSTTQSAKFALSNGHYFISTREDLQPFYGNISEWSRVVLELAFNGKLLSYDEPPRIRIDENEIKVTSDSSVFKYEFERCYILDPPWVQHSMDNVCDVYDTKTSMSEHKMVCKECAPNKCWKVVAAGQCPPCPPTP